MNIFVLYISVLVLTILVEFFIYWAFVKKEPLKLLLFAVLINSLTVPVANYGYQYIVHNIIFIETLVIISESGLLYLLLNEKYYRALLISVCANFITTFLSFFFYL